MSVLDDGASRPDLATRRETKYVFTSHDVATLRHVLRLSCRPVVHAGPVSTVRSIYFDDPALGTCRANLDGVGLRHKTRIRWYDTEQPDDHFFFEIKWRRHRLCGKHRLKLASDTPPGSLPYGTIHAGLRRVLPERLGAHLTHEVEPIVLVEYRREHFELQRGTARFTLDYDIRFYPQIGRRRIARRFPERLPGVVLIECKAGVNDTGALRGALASLRVRPARFSKYVTGCQALGYVSTQ